MSFEENKSYGNRSYQQGDFTASLQCYETCIQLEPTNPVGFANKAMALLKLQRYQEAFETCQLGLELDGPKKIHEKLQYRLKSAREHLAGEPHTVEVLVQEVATLPAELHRL